MHPLIQLLICVLFITLALYYLPSILEKFKMPAPAFWIVGTVLIVLVLIFLANQLGIGGAYFQYRK